MELNEQAKSFFALGDPVRLGIMKIMQNNAGVCGKEIAKQLNISEALVSHHVRILETVGLVERRREGQFSRYTINHQNMAIILDAESWRPVSITE